MEIQAESVRAVEVLDSRARPTLAVSLHVASGPVVRAGVPSGAPTGSREAVKLRDGDPTRFGGKGVLRAVGHVNGEINQVLAGRMSADLAELDQVLVELAGAGGAGRCWWSWTAPKTRTGWARTRSWGCAGGRARHLGQAGRS
jgi:enolase